eukprot:354665-Chlamydomonas_euryale.AAC.1
MAFATGNPPQASLLPPRSLLRSRSSASPPSRPHDSPAGCRHLLYVHAKLLHVDLLLSTAFATGNRSPRLRLRLP